MVKAGSFEARVVQIEMRNARVEADKAWETGFFRRALITIGTYLFSALFLVTINAPNPLLSALVPAAAFVFSTLSLPPLKEWWLSRRHT
jgi:hypothetical protein